MLGIILVLLATVATIFASYRLGTGICEPDLRKRDSDRNTSLTVLALGILFLMCGILALVAGSSNPFDAMTKTPASS
jgi:Ca2+/Na+ antiporter